MTASAPVWSPTAEQARASRLWRFMHELGCTSYPELCQKAAQNPAWFWDSLVKELGIVWSTPYGQVMDTSPGVPSTRWFPNGRLSAYGSAVGRDRRSDPERRALISETEAGPVGQLTYAQLEGAVERTSAGLRAIGVGRGVAVGLYLPLVIENAVALLACTKLGAVAVPLFSGFGAEAIRQRLADADARVLITADGAIRRGRAVAMKPIADEAAAALPHLTHQVVVRCAGIEVPMQRGRDLAWDDLARPERVPAEAMRSDEPLLLLYTSGTTGRPKGTVHGHAGLPIKSAQDWAFGMDVRPAERVMWVTDMGWVMGPLLVFGSLMLGGTAVLYDGAPDHPDPRRVWTVAERHGVTHLGMTLGLWKDPQRYLETYWSRWPGVWVHGDWAMVDEDGLWYILGRSDDTIKVAGKRVGPAEVEAAALDGTAVAEAAAVGIPDPLKGQSVVIFAVARPNADPAPIPAAVSGSVERSLGKPFKPAAVHVIPRLPTTRHGTILRRVIRNVFLGDPPGDLSSIDDMASLDPIRTLGRSSPPADH